MLGGGGREQIEGDSLSFSVELLLKLLLSLQSMLERTFQYPLLLAEQRVKDRLI